MRILQLSDIHFPDRGEEFPVPGLTADGYRERLARALRDIASDVVVLSGDLALTAPSDHLYGTLRELFAQAGRPVCAIPGNHDDGGRLGRFFPPPGRLLSRGPEHCFAAEVAGRRLLFLDSSTGVVGGEALRWLSGEVSGSGSRVFLFMHHPPMLGGAPFMDRSFPLSNHDEVLAVLASARLGAAVFCGHYHCARDLFRGDVAVHVAPSTWVQIEPEADRLVVLPAPPACRVIELDGDGDGYRTWIREL